MGRSGPLLCGRPMCEQSECAATRRRWARIWHGFSARDMCNHRKVSGRYSGPREVAAVAGVRSQPAWRAGQAPARPVDYRPSSEDNALPVARLAGMAAAAQDSRPVGS